MLVHLLVGVAMALVLWKLVKLTLQGVLLLAAIALTAALAVPSVWVTAAGAVFVAGGFVCMLFLLWCIYYFWLES
ncbi:MAG: hypothetical protein K6T26_00610 [Alicyclobacillus sp.]|nr:hypothetical protein [Alicyclobacillus sp.]